MNQNFVLLGCGVVVGVAALAAALQLVRTTATKSGGQQPVIESNRAPSYPPAMGGPDLLQAAAVRPAEVRKRLVDSPDLYAAVSKITPDSPTVDKMVAAEVLAVCAELRPKAHRERAEERAAKELVTRCSGIRQSLRHDGAVERAIELQASAEGDASILGRLAALARRSASGARWHEGDVALVGDALKSGDSVLERAAIRAFEAHLDDGLPDSNLRARAFVAGAVSYMREEARHRTQFDALVDCVNAARCGESGGELAQERFDGIDARGQREFRRLAEQYRLAFQRGTVSATELLAIR